MGILLIASAVYLSRSLVAERNLLILAAVGPAILAAASLGALLVLQAVKPER